MTPSPSSPPGTPSCVVSDDLSPLPRNPMADADSSVKRKRPRLDSGDRAYRSMSADPSLSAVASSEPAQLSPDSDDDDSVTLVSNTEQEDEPPSSRHMNGTPSKVTINVRDSSLAGSPMQSLTSETLTAFPSKESVATNQMGLSDRAPSPPLLDNTLPSSSTGSPQIEVAEPEDMEGHSGPTVWLPADDDDLGNPEASQQRLLDDFPYLKSQSSHIHCLEALAKHFQKGSLADVEDALSLLSEWINRYLKQTMRFRMFWSEMYNSNREFWDALPQVVDRLLKRSEHTVGDDPFRRPLCADQTEYEDSASSLRMFLDSYAALTARMINADTQSLKESEDNPTASPELVATKYIHTFWNAIHLTGDFFRGLRSAGWDSEFLVDAIIDKLIGQLDHGLDCITQQISLQMGRTAIEQEGARNLFVLAVCLVEHISRMHVNADTANSPRGITSGTWQASAWKLFSTLDTRLQELISKQNSALNMESLRSIVSDLSIILERAVVSLSVSKPALIPDGYHKEAEELDLSDLAYLITCSWKMKLFKKCIVQGRMDSRALGVDSMQLVLVEAYARFIKDQTQGTKHVVVRYLADFVLNTKLVEYIVSVESHTQLISRSKNVVGFLLVADKYSDKETDIIWESILRSQDSRIQEAILDMASGIFNIAKYHVVAYWCKKLDSLPLKAFENQHMRQFCSNMSLWLPKAQRDETTVLGDDMAAYRLYIKIIREIFPEQDLSPIKKREVLQFGTVELTRLLHQKVPISAKESLYDSCFSSISQRSSLATGCIVTVNLLLDYTRKYEQHAHLKELESKYHMTELIVNDFVHLTQSQASSNISVRDFPELLTERLKLIARIIQYLPDFITPELTRSLWRSLVGDRALDDWCRDSAWKHLSQAISVIKDGINPFVTRVLSEHFQNLDPVFFTPFVLYFANDATKFQQRMSGRPEIGSDQQDFGNVVDIFWPISLKAKSPELGTKAIETLVENQLNGKGLPVQSKEVIMQSHAAFVEKGIEYLISAAAEYRRLSHGTASSDDEAMVIVATGQEIDAVKLCFIRSLAILRRFVESTRSHRSFSPVLSVKSPLSSRSIDGDEICIKYQPHASGKSPGICELYTGDNSTLEDLLQRLHDLTGFSEFTIIAKGQKIDQEINKEVPLRDMGVLQNALLLLQKIPGSQPGVVDVKRFTLNSVEGAVMGHFDDLYDLLAIDSDLSQEVYLFLSIFPPNEGVATLVCDVSKTAAEVYPPEAAHKAMYSVHVLNVILHQQLCEGAECLELLSHAVKMLSSAVLGMQIADPASLTPLETLLASSYIGCLLKLLKERVPKEVSERYSESPAALVDRLCQLIGAALTDLSNEHLAKLAEICFATILEASGHSEAVWSCFTSHISSRSIIQTLLLETPNARIQDSTRRSIMSVKAVLPTLHGVDQKTFGAFFWGTATTLIPQTLPYHQQAGHFYDFAQDFFMSAGASIKSELPLASYMAEWSELLFKHHHNEFVGRNSIDWVVSGLSRLLEWCIKLIKSDKRPLELPKNLIDGIFCQYLFPKISAIGSEDSSTTGVAVLDSRTRAHLYQTVLATVNDIPSYSKVLHLAEAILPETEENHAWTWGLAQITDEYGVYDSSWHIERQKAIRSPTGYVGMKNLSNTCYLNSLLTQLFMNVGFREFMLDASVSEPRGSQKLLYETKRVFAFMQETWLKAVDPENVSGAILTYEQTPIDVSIQMDVDEFYNLLFDRLEHQIMSNDDKKKFRQFYGGQIIQQIKSKDCPHVSERLEPFSAIQCDISGKATLTESLKTYVGGEIMEGDNKYSCSTCGSYVNAVKRACLRDVPDNLIFHLKRFDYDLMAGARSKINERFEFPDEIDMAPYNIDHLQDTQKPMAADMFTLVGVLIHAGSAEAGHYYSYIRERPGRRGTWLEFNDSDVTMFDPASIDNCCFGGWQDQYYGNQAYPKAWNAYMLFYQRTSALEADQQKYAISAALGPVKANVPFELASRIHWENEYSLRKICAFDPEHIKFVKSMLEKYLYVSPDACSDDYALEQKVLHFSLQHIAQVLARQKDFTEIHPILDLTAKISARSPECCKIFLNWIIAHYPEFFMILVKCPIDTLRRKLRTMVAESLKSLQNLDPCYYGLQSDMTPTGSPMEADMEMPGPFERLAVLLWSSLPQLPLHLKSWDEYYGFLIQLAELGPAECAVLHKAGFMLHCLQILILPRNKHLYKRWPHHAAYYRALERNKTFPLQNLIRLLDILMKKVEIKERFEDGSDTSDILPSISVEERRLLTWTENVMRSPRPIIFLDEIFNVTGDDTTACESIVATLVRTFEGGIEHQAIHTTILGGMQMEPASAARPYLCAALVYCETCPQPSATKEMITEYARDCPNIGVSGGIEYLDFFNRVYRVWNPQICVRKPKFFKRIVLFAAPYFAPHLLYYHDARVRQDILKLLNNLVFDHDTVQMDDEVEADEIEQIGRRLCRNCLEYVESLGNRQSYVDVHRIEQLVKVLKFCADTYCDPENGTCSEMEREYRSRAQAALEALDAIATSSPEDLVSAADYDSEEGFSDYSNTNDAP